jgi:hypothetical protein
VCHKVQAPKARAGQSRIAIPPQPTPPPEPRSVRTRVACTSRCTSMGVWAAAVGERAPKITHTPGERRRVGGITRTSGRSRETVVAAAKTLLQATNSASCQVSPEHDALASKRVTECASERVVARVRHPKSSRGRARACAAAACAAISRPPPLTILSFSSCRPGEFRASLASRSHTQAEHELARNRSVPPPQPEFYTSFRVYSAWFDGYDFRLLRRGTPKPSRSVGASPFQTARMHFGARGSSDLAPRLRRVA